MKIFRSLFAKQQPKFIKNVQLGRVGLTKAALGDDIFQVIKPTDNNRIIIAQLFVHCLDLRRISVGSQDHTTGVTGRNTHNNEDDQGNTKHGGDQEQ